MHNEHINDFYECAMHSIQKQTNKEIQERMSSINDTLKITNAMYMISSSKLKKSKKMLQDTEPYFYELQTQMSRILRHVPDIESKYFEKSRDEKKAQR